MTNEEVTVLQEILVNAMLKALTNMSKEEIQKLDWFSYPYIK